MFFIKAIKPAPHETALHKKHLFPFAFTNPAKSVILHMIVYLAGGERMAELEQIEGTVEDIILSLIHI